MSQLFLGKDKRIQLYGHRFAMYNMKTNFLRFLLIRAKGASIHAGG